MGEYIEEKERKDENENGKIEICVTMYSSWILIDVLWGEKTQFVCLIVVANKDGKQMIYSYSLLYKQFWQCVVPGVVYVYAFFVESDNTSAWLRSQHGIFARNVFVNKEKNIRTLMYEEKKIPHHSKKTYKSITIIELTSLKLLKTYFATYIT